MAKSIKLKDNTFLDSSGIVHKSNTNEIGILKDILGNWGNTQSITDYGGNLNDMLRTGWVTTGTNATNTPPNIDGDVSYYILTFVKNPDYYVKQIGFSRGGNAIYQRRKTAPNTWTSWNKIGGVYTLYDNSTGSSGSITLNKSVATFDFLEIFYKENNGYENSVKVASPNGKYVDLVTHLPTSDTTYIKQRLIALSGTSIVNVGSYYNQTTLKTGSTAVSNSNYIYITRVIGY